MNTAEEEPAHQREEGARQSLRCGQCRRLVPMKGSVFVSGPALGWPRVICPDCLEQVKGTIAAETRGIFWVGAVLWGLGTALAAGAVWYVVGRLWLGAAPALALLGGPATGIAVHLGAGHKRGRALQWLAVGLAALAFLGAEYALAGAGASDLFMNALEQTLRTGYGFGFSILGLWLAWRIPAARRVLGAYPR